MPGSEKERIKKDRRGRHPRRTTNADYSLRDCATMTSKALNPADTHSCPSWTIDRTTSRALERRPSKVLRLRSFQIDQATRRTTESKPRRSALGSRPREDNHQSTSVEGPAGGRRGRRKLLSKRCQTSLANTQPSSKWSAVSSSWSQRAQEASLCRPCL